MKKTAITMAAGLAAALAVPSLSHAEVAASAGVASTYLFRGVDQSDGNAQVFGDLTWTTDMGFYTSIWGSSAGSGTQEYDLIAGWETELGDWLVNTGVINYIYPGDGAADDIGSESEFYLGFAYGGFEAYVYKNVASAHSDNNGLYYFTTGYSWKKAAFNLGYAMNDSAGNATYNGATGKAEFSYAHFDLSYAYSENLSFTLSKVILRDAEVAGTSVADRDFDTFGAANSALAALKDDDLLFVLTYSLPLDL